MNYIYAMIETSNYARPYIIKGKCEKAIDFEKHYIIFDDFIMDVKIHLRDSMSLDSNQ